MTYYDGRGMVGTGSEVYGIQQVRDFYLDKRYWATTPTIGEFNSKKTQHMIVETVFQELNSGFTERMDALSNLYKNLSTDAGDTSYRRDFISNAENLCTYFGDTYEQLRLQQRDVNEEVKIVVDQINSLGSQLASVNSMISIYEIDGSKANDLRDERVRLIDELSKFVNVSVDEVEKNQDYAAGKYPEPEDRNRSHKEYVVKVDGTVFVRGDRVNRLECKLSSYEGKELKNNSEDTNGLFDIYWSWSGLEFNSYSQSLSGELKGLIDMRDGNGGLNPDITQVTVGGTSYPIYTETGNTASDTGTLTFVLDPKVTKVDMPDAGEIKINKRGYVEEVKYANAQRVWNADGTVTVTVDVLNPEQVDPADMNGAYSLSIGKTTDYCGIPYYMAKLNEMVRTVARAINVGEYMNGEDIGKIGGHVGAYNKDGVQTGIFLFTYKDEMGNEISTTGGNYSIYNFTAQNFSVNSAIAEDNALALFGAADGDHGESGNEAVLEYIDALRDDKLFQNGTLNDFISGMMTENAVDAKQAQSFEKSYSDVALGVDTQRESVAGVNLDEEMTNMIKFRQQLQACSMLMNTVNDCYDILINQLGLR
jgi:flagellar hook-associated protein 1 FlgK